MCAGDAALSEPAGPAVVEESVMENARYVPLRGWSSKHLLPTERKRYSRNGISFASFPVVPLPPGWEWEGPWLVDTNGR